MNGKTSGIRSFLIEKMALWDTSRFLLSPIQLFLFHCITTNKVNRTLLRKHSKGLKTISRCFG